MNDKLDRTNPIKSEKKRSLCKDYDMADQSLKVRIFKVVTFKCSGGLREKLNRK